MKKFYRRSISGLLALLICFTTILSSGVTAFAASSSGETAKSYSVAFPRDGDANLDTSGTWGHDELHYMNGWTSGEKTWMTTLHTIGDFNGPACYCICISHGFYYDQHGDLCEPQADESKIRLALKGA